MGRYKTSAQQINIDTRRERVLTLRKAGATLTAIASLIAKEFDQPKYNASLAQKDVMVSLQAISESLNLSAESYRQLELQRLDDYLFRLQPKLKHGDNQATLAALKINERRSKLLGLEAPIQLQIEQGIDAGWKEAVEHLQSVMPAGSYKDLLAGLQILAQRAELAGSN